MKKLKFCLKLLFLAVCFLLLVSCRKELHTDTQHSENDVVRGIDVSSYQEDVDWEIISQNDISFAFIKATEGSSYVDRRFDENIAAAGKTDLAVGAYHFMSFDSDGKSQAKNFISKVKPDMIDLPPVIDLEAYGKYVDALPEFSEVEKILGDLISELTEAYGKTPIIYTNLRMYYLYVLGAFDECDIWMCDLNGEPMLLGGKDWTFWQYSHTEKISGYSGGEKHIDMNIFNGSEKEFYEYLKK